MSTLLYIMWPPNTYMHRYQMSVKGGSCKTKSSFGFIMGVPSCKIKGTGASHNPYLPQSSPISGNWEDGPVNLDCCLYVVDSNNRSMLVSQFDDLSCANTITQSWVWIFKPLNVLFSTICGLIYRFIADCTSIDLVLYNIAKFFENFKPGCGSIV